MTKKLKTTTIAAEQQLIVEQKLNRAEQALKREQRLNRDLKDLIQQGSNSKSIMSELDAVHCAPHIIEQNFFKGDEATAMVLLSDIHAEEKIDARKINGLNESSPDIIRERMDKFFQKTLMLTNHERKLVPIPRLMLAILGDTISGEIHEDCLAEAAMVPMEAISFVEEMLESGIDFLLDKGNFKEIVIPCAVGNHARITKKPRISGQISTNLESLLYKHLAKLYAKDDRVRFVLPQGLHTYVEIYGKKIRFHHGDAIKYQGGVGGISIPVNKAIANWNMGMKADQDCFGHWHQGLDGGRWLSNGSVCGYGPFSLQIKAPFEHPQQTFCILDKHRWKTAVRPIFLD